MLLGALSLYNTSFLPTTELYEALDLDLTHGKKPDAYVKRSEAYQHYARGLRAFKLPERLDIKEAAGIFDTWIKDRALHSSKCLVRLSV
jgi:small subunit ribosomal protein S29